MRNKALYDIVKCLNISEEYFNIVGNRLVISINHNIQLYLSFNIYSVNYPIYHTLNFKVYIKATGNVIDSGCINMLDIDNILLSEDISKGFPENYGWCNEIEFSDSNYPHGKPISMPGQIELSNHIQNTLKQLNDLITYYKYTY